MQDLNEGAMRERTFRMKRLAGRLPSARRGEVRWFSAPGRAEIVGNHTDHNCGKVLVSAISCDILAAVLPEDKCVEIVSEGYRPIRIDLDDLAVREGEKGKSASLLRGVLFYLQKMGPVCGFTAYTSSNIFRGAGVSSSAAFCVLIAAIENALAFGGNLTPLAMAQAGQFAENVYFGKPCGLLDQCGVAFGGLNRIDFADSAAPEITPLPILKGYSAVLTNTGGSHSALTAHYAAIRREMGDVAAFFGKKTLREVTKEEIFDRLPALKQRVSERAILRSIHYFEENDRVDRAAEALKIDNKCDFLAQVQESGESSYKLLQNCFVPGSVTQPVALALKLSEELLKGGAFRMMGGGFTGAVLAFVEEGGEEEYMRGMARVFGKDSVYLTALRGSGVKEIEPNQGEWI